MENLILIKLGGSLITDKTKPFYARETVIRRLAEEIKEAIGSISGKVIVGHGSGSFGHVVAAEYQTQKGIIDDKSVKGLVEVADAAVRLNRIVIKNFLRIGLPVFSVAPGSFIIAKKQKPEKFFLRPILQALHTDLIPVVYGDVILDLERGCCIFSTEKILNILAKNFKKDFKVSRIIHCGDTDGVYDDKGNTIPVITQKSFTKFKKVIGVSRSTDVTGGMLHKVEESLQLASKTGVEIVILNGSTPHLLKQALLGKQVAGTTVCFK
ncbi:isopentenyl phosphate kinase family protein [Candidatus Woesebacteria bacterium]|nr:isopentenyl phosphate kinase family protein [Candidatus Woesebacteria bacterium]